jgi:TetR/AcrR family transcriptional repressor of bet genes
LARAGGDPAADVAAFIDFHLGLGADADPEALACWILLGGEALRQPRIHVEYEKALRGWVDRLAGLIRRGVEQRAFRCDPGAAASALVAAIQGYFVLAATARDVIPRGSAAASAKRMAEGLLHPARPLVREGRS